MQGINERVEQLLALVWAGVNTSQQIVQSDSGVRDGATEEMRAGNRITSRLSGEGFRWHPFRPFSAYSAI